MSRRFGRQQKRKFRTQVAALTTQLLRDQKELVSLLYRMRENEDCIALTRKVLGKHFVGLPVNTLDVPEMPEFIRLANLFSNTDFTPLDGTPKPEAINEALYFLDTYRVELRVDDLMQQVHIRVKSNTPNQVEYALSRSAFEAVPVEHLIREISYGLAHELKRGKL